MTYPFRSALVTGASAGIGAAVAQRLMGDGVEVVLVARRGDRLRDIAGTRRNVEILEADLRISDDVTRVAGRAATCDLVVNNAGFGVHGPVASADDDALCDQLAVNVAAVMRISRAAAAAMVPRGRGWIANVSSVAGEIPVLDGAVYSASKAFVTNFTDSLALELRGSGVHACGILPGYTRTEFHEVSGDAADSVPRWAWQSADDVARIALADVARGRTRSVPGVHNRAAVQLVRFLPASVLHRAIASQRKGSA
jgi:short-subunit dehydrogenase